MSIPTMSRQQIKDCIECAPMLRRTLTESAIATIQGIDLRVSWADLSSTERILLTTVSMLLTPGAY